MAEIDYRDPEWVAKRLGLEKNTVYRYLNEGIIPAVQIGRKWLISESQLADYLRDEARLQTTLRRMQPLAEVTEILEHARSEAAAYKHEYLGEEHILLGLVSIDGEGKNCLRQFGIGQAEVRAAFERQISSGERPGRRKAELTRRAHRALCLAAEHARRQGRVTYGGKDILAGLLLCGEGMAIQLLLGLGLDLGAIRASLDLGDRAENEVAGAGTILFATSPTTLL